MRPAALLLCLALAGCQSNKPIRVERADFSPAEKTHEAARVAVASVVKRVKAIEEANNRQRGSVGRARLSANYESKSLVALSEQAAVLFKAAAPDMRPEVEKLQVQIGALKELHETETVPALADAEKAGEETNAGVQGAKADAATAGARQDELTGLLQSLKDQDEAKTQATNANADLADKEREGRMKAEKKLGWLVLWGSGATLGCAIMAYLLFKP